MASQCPPNGKRSWPELVGRNGEFAAMVIAQENPNISDVVIVATDRPSGDNGYFDCNRVKVKVDQSGNVAKIPTIG